MDHPVVKGVRFFLAHTPGLVRHGSKPSREIAKDPPLWETIRASLRGYEDALAYAPHQVLLGNLTPDALAELQAPWYENPLPEASASGPHGEIVDEELFYALLKAADDFDLVHLENGFVERLRPRLQAYRLRSERDLDHLKGSPLAAIDALIDQGAAPLFLRSGEAIGAIRTDYAEDASLAPEVLLENLAAKAAATMALRALLADSGTPAASIDYVIGSGEEAVGDRYNRGGGNLAKAVAEASGCINATGADVKAFCCGPVHAMVVAGGLVASGVFANVAVVGGCSLAKLGMKFRGHLQNEVPVMEDVLAGFALLMGPDDGESPRLRLDSVGRHTVGAGSAQQQIMAALVEEPLSRLGLGFNDIGKYATELHNPEITDTAGSGDVPRTNYRLIAALAARRGEIAAGSEARDRFVREHGMPGFSPTQGHVASAVPYLGHALDALRRREMRYAMFLAKGSLFLGRMTHLSDGESFILEANPKKGQD
ncbi:MAG TPA: glycine/sarcosine/betaine reductase complex component C subunit beta [Dehalococcoidia bacterium]|nr:glycine/sarcosine/betaine reductase complex component C subunit beta [Dehalococcoidia bacterium]